MSQLVDRLIDLPPWLVLLVAFALPAAEASIFIGVVVPGEIAIVIAGVLAHAHRLPLWLVIVAGTLGAVLGDSAGYEIGARYGDRLLAKLPHRLVKPEHVDRGRALVRRRGGWAVLIGRFTAALRALVPGLAGTSRLPYRTFLPFNVVGGLAWVTMSALIGYVAGASYKAAEHQLSLVSGGLLGLVVLAVLFRVTRDARRRRAGLAPQPVTAAVAAGSVPEPVAEPAAEPATTVLAQPARISAAEPATTLAAEPATTSAAEPATTSAAEPAAAPSAGAAGEPGPAAVAEPVAESAGGPPAEPSTGPTAVAEPAATTQPAPEPGGEPTTAGGRNGRRRPARPKRTHPV